MARYPSTSLAARAFSQLSKAPNTAEPLPDIWATTAPNCRSLSRAYSPHDIRRRQSLRRCIDLGIASTLHRR